MKAWSTGPGFFFLYGIELIGPNLMQLFSHHASRYRSLFRPSNIPSNTFIKAESKCLIWAERLENGTPAIFKMYYRRGIINFIREMILNLRTQREFKALSRLDRSGISCSKPIFWTYGYCKAYGFYEILGTRQISNAGPLTDFLAQKQVSKKDMGLESLFQMAHMMHESGIYHGALSTKNILIDAGGNDQPKYYIIDLARSCLFPGSIIGKKIAWYDIIKIVTSIESDLGIGYCKTCLARYGLKKSAIKKFYQDAKPHRSFSRKQKRVKNTRKVKIFILSWATKFAMKMSRLKLFSRSPQNRSH
jgi:tRNA A-37 threonylcarbamoyl transferase component Bud32